MQLKTKSDKLILRIICILILIQCIRILLKQSFFIIIPHNSNSDLLVKGVVLIILIPLFMLFSSKQHININILPNKFSKSYIITTILFVLFFIITPIITKHYTIYDIYSLFYSAILIPLFEESIFRGYIWERLKLNNYSEIKIYVITTILFSFWHLGYIDSIIYSAGTSNLLHIMLMKMLTGLIFGILLGALRLRTHNCYSTMLLHGSLNIFGT